MHTFENKQVVLHFRALSWKWKLALWMTICVYKHVVFHFHDDFREGTCYMFVCYEL